ncbi:MAG: S8 family serine peptidase [bacterium]|nr:S8 family serine peptidase [bacterium]
MENPFRICALVLAATCAASTVWAQDLEDRDSWTTSRDVQVATTPEGARYVPDELLVTWSAAFTRDQVVSTLATLDAVVIGEERIQRLMRVQLRAGSDAYLEAQRFAALPGVELAELNGIGEGGLVPNDTHFGAQWHHQNTATNPGTPGADIETVPAWDITTGSSDVLVAVLDTGIRFNHPEFIGRTVPGFDFVNNDNDATSDHPHGDNVTGLIAANANNNFGGVGVDWNCTILPVKILDASNLGLTSNLIAGINYSAAQGADVLSMSLINYPGTGALETALQNARNAGSILMACAGNGGIGNADNSWPGASVRTISIGATTSSDFRASFSGTGSRLDFVAPGSSVRTTNQSPTNTVISFSGCSAATPVAAGIVSLLVARFPLLTQDQAYELLRLGAEDQVGPIGEDAPGRDDFFGHGRLNAWRSQMALDANMDVLGYYCQPAVANSTGNPAHIIASGSIVASDDDLTLGAVDLPPNQFGYFIMGSSMGTFMPASSSGFICVDGGVLARIFPPILDSGMDGTFEYAVGTNNIPTVGSIVSGETWNFQAWYRDHPSNNFSDALSIQFL